MSSSQLEQLELFSNPKRLTVREAIALFHELEGRFKSRSYKWNYPPILRIFGDRHLHTINKVDIENYRRTRELDGLKGSAINREHSMLTRLFNAFSEWKGIGTVSKYNFADLEIPPVNPGELVKKVDERAFTRTLVLTPMEFFKFCDYAHPRIRVIVILALLTLLRRKNLQLLDKDKFNRSLQQLQLVQSKTKVPITLPVPETVAVIIENAKYNCICDFTNFKKLFKRAKDESGVHFWMTDLRRTGATQMFLDGVDLKTIQRYLGHTTLVMTEKYLQPPDQNMMTAAKKLETKMAPSLELVGLKS